MPHWRFMGYCFKLLNVFTTSGSKPLISIYICYLWQCFFPLFLMPVCYCCLWEYSAVSLLPFQKCHITSLCLYPHQKYKNWIWQPYSGCHIQKKKNSLTLDEPKRPNIPPRFFDLPESVALLTELMGVVIRGVVLADWSIDCPVLKSSKGRSSGMGKPDLYRSITVLLSCRNMTRLKSKAGGD